MLGSIGEELDLAICLRGWVKPDVSKVGLGSMSSHSKDSISNKVAPRGVSCKMAFFQLWNIEPKVCGHVVHTFVMYNIKF